MCGLQLTCIVCYSEILGKLTEQVKEMRHGQIRFSSSLNFLFKEEQNFTYRTFFSHFALGMGQTNNYPLSRCKRNVPYKINNNIF